MTKRCEIILCPINENDAPRLLVEILDEVKRFLLPSTMVALCSAEGEDRNEVAEAQEIEAKICEKIGHLKNERQRLIQQREEAVRNVELEQGHDKKAHKEHTEKLETQRLREKAQSLREFVDSIKTLHELGVEIDVDVV